MSSPTLTSPPVAGTTADDQWRTRNLGALLFAATDRCVRDKLRVLRAEGFGEVSEAQLGLFNHLDSGGARLTLLAARAGLTKQSMIELVDRAATGGFVERRPDPVDRRAKTVHLTAAGLLMRAGLDRGIAAAEAGVLEAFGPAFLAEVKGKLIDYGASDSPNALPIAQSANVARLFATAARRLSHEALTIARDDGGEPFPDVLLALFRNLDLAGGRLTEIAARARVTKPSMRELVDRAENLGFVTRRDDPADGRAKVIAFTAAGLTMLDGIRQALAVAEHGFVAKTGAAFTSRLKTRLVDYAAAPARNGGA